MKQIPTILALVLLTGVASAQTPGGSPSSPSPSASPTAPGTPGTTPGSNPTLDSPAPGTPSVTPGPTTPSPSDSHHRGPQAGDQSREFAGPLESQESAGSDGARWQQ